ncbi:MAG: DinB family protein [Anaerolineae bacterium]|nr:DinB family protein [Anaerolineae bacterium]NUQ06422.1 DinB family protein [Anaerolineae bacterium]
MADDSRLMGWLRVARGIEAGGHYNLSKLAWALAYAEEIKLSGAAGIPRGEALHQALEALIADLRAEAAPPEIVSALERGLVGLRTEQPEIIPPVYVSRTCGDLYIGGRPAQTACDDDPLDLREFRPHYYLEPLPVPQLLEALRTFPATITAILEGVTDEQMTIPPAPEEWSVKELLAHLDVAQGLLLHRAQAILTEENPVLGGVSAWLLTSNTLNAREIFAHYAAVRAETLALLTPLKPEDWWRTARHGEFGVLTLQEHASYFTRHERSHTRQMIQIVRALT